MSQESKRQGIKRKNHTIDDDRVIKKPKLGTSLQDINPEIGKQWHTALNHGYTPSDVGASSHLLVWWLCEKETCEFKCKHEWLAQVSNRSRNGHNCPFCAQKQECQHQSWTAKFPQLVKEWHPTKNSHLSMSQLHSSSSIAVWWMCSNGICCVHEWKTTLRHRIINKSNCPFCSYPPMKVCKHSSFAIKQPELLLEWHKEKNENIDPFRLSEFSSQKVWWKCLATPTCGCPHEWQAIIKSRTKVKNGCPFCRNPPLQVCEHNSLQFFYPNIANQWHPTKNLPLMPSQVSFGSSCVVWWKCNQTNCKANCEHIWETSVSQRQKSGCPYCSLPPKRICKHNSIVEKFPEMAKEWHLTLNKNIDPCVICPGSDKRYWWQCLKNKEHPAWYVSPNTRTFGLTGCPTCRLSHMEKAMHAVLLKLQQEFKTSKTIIQNVTTQCRKICPGLIADFYVQLKHEATTYDIVIETDGRQHFEPIAFFGGEETFAYQQKRDQQKNKYCQEHNIHLLRISDDIDHKEYQKIVNDFISSIISTNVSQIIFSTVGVKYKRLK